MNKNKLILGIILSALMITSCVKDLDVQTIDPNYYLPSDLEGNPANLKNVLAKIYAGFVTRGQDGNDNDINSDDANFTCFIRAWWNVQELTTDEVKCAWGDPGIPGLNMQTWTASNPFLEGVYSRIIWLVTLSNDYIRITADNTDPDVIKYNAEARFLRALAYYYAIDLFGNPAFTTEADLLSTSFFPKQIDRKALFDYIESELLELQDILGDPKFENFRADKAAAWMLLAKLYLNAEVYTGTARWADCKIYCDKVINGPYSLAPNYRQNFSSDNDISPEMIFAFAQDGLNIQGPTGTSFIIHSSSNGTNIDANNLGFIGSGVNWGGNRTTKQCVNVLVDTLAVYGNNSVISAEDTYFDQVQDTRIFLQTLTAWDIMNISTYGQGVGVCKFTNNRSDGGAIVNYNSDFSSTDFPIFRLSEAYLMRAEALLKSGDAASAVVDVNMVRARAFGNTSHNINAAQLTEQFLLDEYGREFYYEGHRRTDLIRFGQFSNGTYTWAWKGGDAEGIATSKYLDLFPIPDNEVSANPNILQNKGY